MPTQKEVIHLTIGTLSNHISTHFFNQQSSHFQYSDNANDRRSKVDDHKDDDDLDGRNGPALLLDPIVDFQEGVGTRSNEKTFFPRQVVVDFRDSLGTRWDAYDVIFDEEGSEDEANASNAFGIDDDDTILRPSRAANEGLHAWSSPAIVERSGVNGKIRSTRFGPTRDVNVDDDDDDEDSEWDEGEGTHMQEDLEHTIKSEKRPRHRPLTYLTPAAYAHNPHHPRSLCPLPRLFGGGSLIPMGADRDENAMPLASFESGVELARSMERDESIMDEQIRWFAEDSDALQSFSLCAATADGFSGVAHHMLSLLADEYPKTSVMAWGADYNPVRAGVPDDATHAQLSRLRKTNNILSLWSLSSAALYTPMKLPSLLSSPPKEHFNSAQYFSPRANWEDMYNIGGLFAAHIDTTTLTNRLHDERLRRSTATLAATLNWRRDTPIATLGGCMPIPLLAPMAEPARALDPIEALLAARGYDPRKADRRRGRERDGMRSAEQLAAKGAEELRKSFLLLSPHSYDPVQDASGRSNSKPYAQAVVARDDDRMANAPTYDCLEAWMLLDEPAGSVDVVPVAYNVRQACFPPLFRRLAGNGRPIPAAVKDKGAAAAGRGSKVDTLPMLASLSTTPATAELLSEARSFLDATLIRGHDPLAMYGLGGFRGRSGSGQAASDDTEGVLGGREGLMEVRERLEELLGAYEEGLSHVQSAEAEDERMGTDEEFGAEDGSDWDLDD